MGEGGRVMVGEVMFKYCIGRVLKSESQIEKGGWVVRLVRIGLNFGGSLAACIIFLPYPQRPA